MTNEMTINFDMLGALTEDEIGCYVSGTSVISKERDRSAKENTQLKKKTPKPNNFTVSKRHGPIFSFY